MDCMKTAFVSHEALAETPMIGSCKKDHRTPILKECIKLWKGKPMEKYINVKQLLSRYCQCLGYRTSASLCFYPKISEIKTIDRL